MNVRRDFMKLAPLALGAAATASASDDWGHGDPDSIVGSWNSIHSLPFPPGSFREFLSFSEGGVVHETNTFLYTTSNLDFSMFGLPNAINAADGVGSWKPAKHGGFDVTFRKFLFNPAHQNFGDLLVTGTVYVSKNQFSGNNWHIVVVDLNDKLLVDFGGATSKGVRIG